MKRKNRPGCASARSRHSRNDGPEMAVSFLVGFRDSHGKRGQMTSRVIGEQPKPRALIFGFDDSTARRIETLFPTPLILEDFDDIEQREWDVLITTRSLMSAAHHLYVIGLGCDAYDARIRGQVGATFGHFHSATQPRNESTSLVVWKPESRARELVVPGDLPPSVRRLLQDLLIPLMQPERIHQLLGTNDSRPETQEELTNCMKPFVATRYGDCIAGSFPRPGARSECWCFPGYANSLAPEVVEVALREWHRLDPETFPLADWIDQELWHTPDERRAAKELEDLESERTAFLAKLAERQQHLAAKLTEAKQSADAHERRLLTDKGDDLVDVTTKCFSDFGFDVTNMDKVYPEGDRREDLQITVEEVPDWIALVEVRSYRGGAQSSDLLRIGRFSKRYLKDTGKERMSQSSWNFGGGP
jgi:hypothetical protein